MTKTLGITEIKRDKKVKRMCMDSKPFGDLVNKLFDIDAKITINNNLISEGRPLFASFFFKNAALKIEKLWLKRFIQIEILKFEKNQLDWFTKNSTDNVEEIEQNEKQKPIPLICYDSQALTKKKVGGNKKPRTRQCRKMNTGKI